MCYTEGMLSILLMAMSVQACPPSWYSSLPRDGEWYYGVGKGADAEAARENAHLNLEKQVGGEPVGWEQDDFQECQNEQYALVRVEKSRVVARPPASLFSWMKIVVDKLDKILYHVDVQKPTTNIIITSPTTKATPIVQDTRMMLLRGKSLAPVLKQQLERIDSGVYGPDSVASVVAMYKAMGEPDKMLKFCNRMKPLSQGALAQWLDDNCTGE